MSVDSFVFYRSFSDALRDLPPDDFKNIILALADYALDDKISELSGSSKMALEFMKPLMDSNKKKRENGKKGGEAPRSKTKQTEAPRSKTEKPRSNEDEDEDEDMDEGEDENINKNKNIDEAGNINVDEKSLKSPTNFVSNDFEKKLHEMALKKAGIL